MFSHLLLLVLLAVSGQSASIGGRYARHVLVPVAHPFYSTGSAMSYGAFFGQGPGTSFAANNVITGVGNPGHPGSHGLSAGEGAAPEHHQDAEAPGVREVQHQAPASEPGQEDPAPVMAVMLPVMPVIADEAEMESSSDVPASEETTTGSGEVVEESSEGVSEGPVSEDGTELPLSEESTGEPFSEEVTEEHESQEITEEPHSQEITTEPLSESITEEPVSEGISEEPISEEVSSEEPISDEPASEAPTSDEPASEEITPEVPASEEPTSDEPAPETVPEKQAVYEDPEQPSFHAEEPETGVSLHDSTPDTHEESPGAPETAHKEHEAADERETPKKKATPKEQSLPGKGKPQSFPGFGGAFGWNVFPEKFFGGATPHFGGGSGGGSSASAKASSSSSSSGNGASFASSHASAFSGSGSGRW